jgi:peptidyl-prolyl cis-trans isomerase SurA
VPEFTAVALNLRGNEVSRVVKTDYGYHLIQVIDRKGSAINARHILLRPKVSEEEKNKVKRLLDSLATDIRKGEIEFEKAATRFSEDEQTKANGGLMVNMMTGSTKFEPRELDPEVLAQVNQLKVGEVSEPFESTDDNMNTVYKIIMLESRQMAHQADIKTDYQYIQNFALASKQNEALNDWFSKKLKTTYIKINEDYQGCKFNLEGWVK